MYDSVEIPDAIEPLVGYRGWLVRGGKLASCYRDATWPVDGPVRAECVRPTFAAMDEDAPIKAPVHWRSPHRLCTCGVYALAEHPARDEFRPWPSDAVVGMVHGWGKVVMCDGGWRAEYARPIALVARRRGGRWPARVLKLADAYGIEVVDERSVGSP